MPIRPQPFTFVCQACHWKKTIAPLSDVLGCSGLMKPDTHLGENARPKEVSDDQATPYLYP